MKKLLSWIALIALVFNISVLPVAAEPELNLHLPPSTRVVLPNGLTLIVRERPGEDNVGVFLTVGAGQVTEEENQVGITNFLQNYLMEIPVEKVHDSATAIESQGGVISADSGPDTASISANITAAALPLTLRVFGDLMHVQSMDAKVFHNMHDQELQDIQHLQQQTYQALYDIFLQEFYSFHPYKVPVQGTLSSVKKMTPADLLAYYHRYYVPNNMVLAVVGNVNTDRVIQMVNRYFSNLAEKPLPSKNIYYQPILDDNRLIQLQESGNVAWLFTGFSAPELKSDDYATMQMINSILGASMSSRIWLSIREKRGLSYELGSEYSAREGPSHFIIYVATSPENLNESKRNLLKEVERMRRESLTDSEMLVTRRRVIGQYILSLETNLAQAQSLAWNEIMGRGVQFDETYIHLLQTVTASDVLRVAKKYLDSYILISVQ